MTATRTGWADFPMTSFEVPGIPKSPNVTRTRCFHVNSSQANDWKAAIVAAVADNGPEVPLPSVRLVLVALTKTRGRRDPDNFAAACKPIIDGLVLAGVLLDDSFNVIRELVVRHELAGRNAVRIEVWA